MQTRVDNSGPVFNGACTVSGFDATSIADAGLTMIAFRDGGPDGQVVHSVCATIKRLPAGQFGGQWLEPLEFQTSLYIELTGIESGVVNYLESA